LKNVYLNPSSVVVTINLSSETVFATLPIIPMIENAPPPNFGIKSVTINPSVVTVSGPISIISALKSIQTQPIDVSKLVNKTDIKANLIKVDKTNLPFDSCTVTIEVEPLVSKTFVVPVEVIVQQGKQYTLSQDHINIVLKGFKGEIDAIIGDTIKCTIDASNLESGSYTLPVGIIGVPANLILETTMPSSIEVKIY